MPIRLLIVDDDEQFQRIASGLLAARGCKLLGAVPGGDAALEYVSGACPDGVLLDLNLPGEDGFAVAAAIHAVCPSARIVLTSSDTEQVPRSALDACGASEFVAKTALVATDLERLFGT
jgi:CheY-like chemotaxis protein